MSDNIERFIDHKWKHESKKNIPLGGTVKIQYADTPFMVGAPLAHVHQAIDLLKKDSRAGRRRIMASVNTSIRQMLSVAGEEKTTTKQAVELAQDITIWYANEILEGRKNMEDLEFIT